MSVKTLTAERPWAHLFLNFNFFQYYLITVSSSEDVGEDGGKAVGSHRT
jgi:hypothetical protein